MEKEDIRCKLIAMCILLNPRPLQDKQDMFSTGIPVEQCEVLWSSGQHIIFYVQAAPRDRGLNPCGRYIQNVSSVF